MKHLAAMLLLATAAFADPPQVILPGSVQAKPGRLVRIQLTTDAKSFQWLGPEGDADLIAGDGVKWAVFSAPVPGRYRVVVFAASATGETSQATCWVEVSGPVPPPGPGPGPADALSASIQAAAALDKDLTKAPALANALKLAAGDAAACATAGDLIAAYTGRRKAAGVADGDLTNVRRAMAAHLDAEVGHTSDAVIDKAKAAAAFNRLAAIVGGLK